MRLLRFASLLFFAWLSACSSADPDADPIVGASCTPDVVTLCSQSQKLCGLQSDGARCVACADGSSIASGGTCTPIDGTPLIHDFPSQTIEPGAELFFACRSWTLNNDSELWINAVELRQTEESHHANFVFVPDDKYAGPDGIWQCEDRGYDFYLAAAAGGVLFNQSTQAVHEVQRFPKGAAIRIPPRSRVISDIHLLNTGSDSVTGHAHLTLYALEAAEVTSKLRAFHVEYDDLHIAPHSSARFTATCAVAPAVSKATGAPFAPKIHYLLPHTHTLATAFFADVLGGPSDGRKLLDLQGFNGEGHGHSFDPPVDMTGSAGLTFGCQYTNPRNKAAGWGFGSDEMCELFGFAEDSVFFQSRVHTGASAGRDGAVDLFAGDCATHVLDL